MSHLDHTAVYQEYRDRILDGLRTHFPMNGKLQTLHLEGLEVRDEGMHADDLEAQKAAKMKGEAWAAPVMATLVLKDNKTGAVVDRKVMSIAEVPLLSRRHSLVLEGNEWQVDHQWQLKPGAYTRRRQTGELETQFNVTSRRPFDLTFDPKTKLFRMSRGSTTAIELYPILKTMGVDDDTLKKTWGDEIFEANKRAKLAGTAVDRFYKADKKKLPPSPEEARQYVVDTLTGSQLRSDAVKFTLGKPFSNVSGEVLAAATKKMLKVHAGEPEDDRDSLVFKDLRFLGDYAYDRLTDWKTVNGIRTKVSRKINYAKSVRDVVKTGLFGGPLRGVFHDNAAARVADQANPVEMLSAANQTTLMGSGGIKSAFTIEQEAKFINPTHMGFLDPVRTPEGGKTGVSLRLPIGVRRDGRTPTIPLYNLKTNKLENVPATTFYESKVVMPDQVTWKDGRPVPLKSSVQISVEGNELKDGKFSDAQYVMRHPSQMFTITTNLIPFLGNNSGNRATYATQHLEQAIALKDREPPLVQVTTGSSKPGLQTFEELVGRQSGHPSPVSGVVEKVTSKSVTIRAKDGKVRTVQLYDNFPLNDPKSMMHSTPLVKPGERVQIGQSVADTNFTKDGVLALGKNLRVGYVPFKGYNFEDGVVISESAAAKLTSEHLHKPSMLLDEQHVTDTKKFEVQHPGAFTRKQFEKIGADGVIRVGQAVHPGDPLVVAMRPFQLRDRMGVGAARRSLSGQHTDSSLRWESDYSGEVVAVNRNKKGEVTVHVRTVEPMQLGDKISGRHGNKGIISSVLPDHEMPHTKDGKPLDVVLNPSGVPGRMNIGQMLETAASKIAKKTGRTYVVDNFSQDDAVARVKAELKKHGLSDTEELIDPVTGVSLGHALVGDQYTLKLKHTIDKKISARAGMGLAGSGEFERYDSNLIPAGGGKSGGQSIGSLGMNVMLAHGAKANIREMQTWKSEGPDPQPLESKRWPSQHIDVWAKIQMGEPLPTPTSTFAYKKFTDMLKGAGINVEKKGHNIQLLPLTDKQILAMSNGALPEPVNLTYSKFDKNGELVPRPGGLFDPKLTGSHGGKHWTHIKLSEPVPNPVFEGAIKKLLGLSNKNFDAIVHGESAVTSTGKLVPLGTAGATTGGAAIKSMLERIDVKKELEETRKQLSQISLPKGFATGGSTVKVDTLVKKVKYLQVLDRMGARPSETYVLHNLPVLPPVMRPVAMMADGSPKWEDLNGIYQSFAQVNKKLGDPLLRKNLTDDQLKQLRFDAYDGVKALTGLGSVKDERKGILDQIHGSSPKLGYFQKTLLSRRQDLTMRSVIVPEPALSLDEVGVPEKKAMTVFRPFVVNKLIQMGAASSPLAAQKLIKDDTNHAKRALELVAEERPVILKRDPALHKYSVQAFRAKIVQGRAIKIHPLTVSGFNADFDGDTMSMYVPISREAVEEAHKMFPSNNLFNDTTGTVVYQPTLESALGLFKLSRVNTGVAKSFETPAAALKAVQDKKLTVNDPVLVRGMKTTPGRLLLADSLPAAMRESFLKGTGTLDKKGLTALFSDLAKKHSTEFATVANKLKDIGNGASFGAVEIRHPNIQGATAIMSKETPAKNIQYIPTTTHSLSLDDVQVDRGSRDKFLSAAQREVDTINASSSFTPADKDRRAVDVWLRAGGRMEEAHRRKISANPTNLSLMQDAGVKPSWTQYQQMVLAPLLVKDASGRTIPQPIKRSYSEGLTLGEYWTQMSGARRGSVMKVQETSGPGALSKSLLNTTMNLVIAQDDCGTARGVVLPASSKDVYDRVLAKPFAAKGVTVPAGQILSPDIVSKILSTDKNAQLMVRSPLKCDHAQGLCQKCVGLAPTGRLYDVGTNLGVLSAQALGERSMQVTLKSFHSGGVVSLGERPVTDDFERIEQLTYLPKKLPNAATLAMTSGKVERVENDATGTKVWVNGQAHHVGKDRSGRPLAHMLPHAHNIPDYKSWTVPKVGTHVEAGQMLSDPNRTNINPHDLYRATHNMERVQSFLTDELHDIYKKEGVRRLHVETVVKAMGNLTKVRDPGDAENILRGDFQPHSKVRSINRELVKAGKQPIEHSPVLQGVRVLPFNLQEDWMAKLRHENLRATLQEAASTGAVSNIHGLHPIPAVAYGAEFGYNVKHHLRPGYEKFKNVPTYAY